VRVAIEKIGTLTLKETLEYYRQNKTTVYYTMLDATKAFHRVEYCKLVRFLLNIKLPAVELSQM